jgi:hypothetical protein
MAPCTNVPETGATVVVLVGVPLPDVVTVDVDLTSLTVNELRA